MSPTSIATGKLQKLRRSLYWLCLANLGASLLYVGLGWLLYSNVVMPDLNKVAPYLWAVLIGFGVIGFVYSSILSALWLKGISVSEQLLRSGKRRDTRLVRIEPYPLCNLVFCLLTPKDGTDTTAKKSTRPDQEVVFIGLASEAPPFKFAYRTFADLTNLPAVEVTAHSDQNGKLRLLTYGNDSLIQVSMVFPANLVALVSAMYGAK